MVNRAHRLAQADVAPVRMGGFLHARAFLTLMLMAPLIFIFAVTIGGYLYFNYLQIRTAIADEEHHRIIDAARTLRDELSVASDAESLEATLAGLTTSRSAHTWLVDNRGVVIAGRASDGVNAFAGAADDPINFADLYPDVWPRIGAEADSSEMLEPGIVSYAQVCGELNCGLAAGVGPDGNTPNLDISDVDGWNLVSIIPGEQLDWWYLLGDNTDRWLLITVLLSAAGLCSLFFAGFLASTLTTLHGNESRLKRAGMLLDAFFEKNPEIMFVKNLDGSFYLANEKCRQLAGAPKADFTGVDRGEVFPADASSTMAEQDKQVISNEEAMEFHTHWKREGVLYHFKTLRFPMYAHDGELIAVGGIANDVTDQVQNRHALMENERLLRTFIESAPDAVLISDSDGQVTLVNRQAELIFDYDREQMLNQNLFDLITGLKPADFTNAVLAGRKMGDEVFRESLEASGIGRNNRHFPVEYSLAPVNTDEGSLMICLLRDVSDKALMETQLRQSQKMEAIGKLTGGMAHDFNNLLGIIIGNIALALRQVKDNERVQKRLNTALKASERGADLTKRMLAVARRQPLQPKPVAINSVVQELSEMLPQTLGSDIEMDLRLDPELPPILVDESGFEGMLLNLAINSRDAMPQGGQFTITTGLKGTRDIENLLPQTLIRDNKYVHIVVADTGTGMSEEALNRAFEPFFTTKEKGKGTGLGLAMIYGFVKQSHGYIIIDSKLGEGTTVHIFLPAQSNARINELKPRGGKAVPLLDDKGRTVLIVDDETDLLEIAEAYLEEMGFKVLTAASGVEAMEIILENPNIDLMITDVVMPGGLNGPALVSQVREKCPQILVLYASGFPSGVVAESAGVELDAPLINKPYTRETLADMVSKLLMQPEEVQ